MVKHGKMAKERDGNGRFVKGHKQGFTETKQPVKNGRKKHLVSDVLDSLKGEGYEEVSAEQTKQVYTFLIGLDQSKLTELGSNTEIPMLYRIIAREILSKKGFEVIEKMIDRAHGKPTNKTEMELSGAINIPKIKWSDDDK